MKGGPSFSCSFLGQLGSLQMPAGQELKIDSRAMKEAGIVSQDAWVLHLWQEPGLVIDEALLERFHIFNLSFGGGCL